jgi:uncharacterized protein YyaL (SSP411 family)
VPNALAHEKSPYLLQHAHNPVEWMPWGEAAFARAKTENKLIFLSVGYSTCHWCHVMERESFENPEVAAVMNRHFINVKVDREERPDVDHIYMTFVQATTGHGGWPMSVWLTPDLKPVAGGTYFPPEDRYGRPGFVTVLERLAELWTKERERLVRQGGEVLAALQREGTGEVAGAVDGVKWDAALEAAFRSFQRAFDPVEGGFGGAPKFPRPAVLDFLFRYAVRRGLHHGEGSAAAEMALATLRKMAAGGMFDHVGGGFHRYSVDARWHVPHFEKMLYDQAQLVVSYVEAMQLTGEASYGVVAQEIIEYVARDLTSPEGGFYSAEDADSLPAADSREKTEGAFYVWRDGELKGILSADEYAAVARWFGVRAEGNVAEESDPHGELTGLNVLIRAEEALDEVVWAQARMKLKTARDLRPRPHLDDKILTAWNGLMIGALARAAVVLDRPEWLGRAERAAVFVRDHLWVGGELRRSYREGVSPVRGFLADYAFLIRGLIDLYEAGGEGSWLDWAVQLQAVQDRLFGGKGVGAYFSTREDDPSLILRMKEDYDGAEPSGNAVAVFNLLRLEAMTGRKDYGLRARAVLAEYAGRMKSQGTALPLMLAAADAAEALHAQVVLAGDFSSPEGRALRRALAGKFRPRRVVLHAGRTLPEALAGVETLHAMTAVEGRPTVYVCEDFVCRAPVTTAAGLTG